MSPPSGNLSPDKFDLLGQPGLDDLKERATQHVGLTRDLCSCYIK